ncbi:nucleoside-diphosphate kinase [Candidatus Dependentiae bacterium]
MEKTFAIIKPDAVKAKNTGKIIDMIEQNGFTVLRMEKTELDPEEAKLFYAVHKDKPFFQEVIDFMCSGPIVIMALEKENAIDDWRKLMGATDSKKAEAGTIRNLYGTDIMLNATHGSDSPENAKTELSLFFPELV